MQITIQDYNEDTKLQYYILNDGKQSGKGTYKNPQVL